MTPTTAQDPLAVAFDDGYADATRRAYSADWRCFVSWCEANSHAALPASPDAVAAFVDAKAEARKPATVARYVTCIAVVHRDRNLPDPTKSRLVTVALKRMYRKRGRRQRQALAVNLDLRNRMLAAAPKRLIGLRDRALLATAYDLGCRRAELVAVLVEDIERADDGSATILLRRSKTDQDGSGQIRYIAADTLGIIDTWLDQSEIEDGLLFRPVDRHGNVGDRLAPAEVGRIWKKLVAAAGGSDELVCGVSGHSTRVGMAQDMAGAGIDMISIMQAGGWKTSSMVARYIERLEARNGAVPKLVLAQHRCSYPSK